MGLLRGKIDYLSDGSGQACQKVTEKCHILPVRLSLGNQGLFTTANYLQGGRTRFSENRLSP